MITEIPVLIRTATNAEPYLTTYSLKAEEVWGLKDFVKGLNLSKMFEWDKLFESSLNSRDERLYDIMYSYKDVIAVFKFVGNSQLVLFKDKLVRIMDGVIQQVYELNGVKIMEGYNNVEIGVCKTPLSTIKSIQPLLRIFATTTGDGREFVLTRYGMVWVDFKLDLSKAKPTKWDMRLFKLPNRAENELIYGLTEYDGKVTSLILNRNKNKLEIGEKLYD